MKDSRVDARGGGLRIPRSRGAISGFLLIILGVWGALVPFIGPRFNFAYTPDQQWTWTAARGWLEVFPGVATVVGGLLLLGSANLLTAMTGGWLSVLAGAWFVVGDAVAPTLRIGAIGNPVASTDVKRALLEIAYFSGLGAVIIFLGAVVLGRLSVRNTRDIEYTRDAPAYESPPPDSVTQSVPEQPATPESESEPKTRGGLFRRRRKSTPAA